MEVCVGEELESYMERRGNDVGERRRRERKKVEKKDMEELERKRVENELENGQFEADGEQQTVIRRRRRRRQSS